MEMFKKFDNIPETPIQEKASPPFKQDEIQPDEIGIHVSYKLIGRSRQFIFNKEKFVLSFNQLKTPKYAEKGGSQQWFKVTMQDSTSIRTFYLAHSTAASSFFNAFLDQCPVENNDPTWNLTYNLINYLKGQSPPESTATIENLPLRVDLPITPSSPTIATTSRGAKRARTVHQIAAASLLPPAAAGDAPNNPIEPDIYERSARLVMRAIEAASSPGATEESVKEALLPMWKVKADTIAAGAMAAVNPDASVQDIFLAIAQKFASEERSSDNQDALMYAQALFVASKTKFDNWLLLHNQAANDFNNLENPLRAFYHHCEKHPGISYTLFAAKRASEMFGEQPDNVKNVVKLYTIDHEVAEKCIEAVNKVGQPLKLYQFLKENSAVFNDPSVCYAILMAASSSTEKDYKQVAAVAENHRFNYLPTPIILDVIKAARPCSEAGQLKLAVGNSLFSHGVKMPFIIETCQAFAIAAVRREAVVDLFQIVNQHSEGKIPCVTLLMKMALAARNPSASAEEIERQANTQLADPQNPLFRFTDPSEANFFPALVQAVFLFGPNKRWIPSMIGLQFRVADKVYMENLHDAVALAYNTRDHQLVTNFLKEKYPENFAHIAQSIREAVAIIETDNPFVPPAEDLNKRFSHEKWMDRHHLDQAELWHPDHLPPYTEIFQKLWNYVYPGHTPPLDAITHEAVAQLIHHIQSRVSKKQLVPDYELPLWLFHLKDSIEDDAMRRIFDETIAVCAEHMPILHKGMMAKFAALIDTGEGDAFREVLYPFLYRWSEWCDEKAHSYDLQKNKHGWYSVQHILRRQIEVTQELIKTGTEGLARSRYEGFPHYKALFDSPLFRTSFDLACQGHIEHCRDTLASIENGKAVELPKFYHGIANNKNPESEVIPEGLLGSTAKLLPRLDRYPFAPNFVGTFLSTRQAADWGPPYFAFGDSIAWRNDVVNLSYERGAKPTEAEYWVGFGHKRGIPIALNTAEQQHRFTPVALISPDHVRQGKIVEASGGESLPIRGTLSALIEQYCIEQITPFHCPKHWPLRAMRTREWFFNSNRNNKYYRSNLAFVVPHSCYSRWLSNGQIYPLLHAASQNPSEARRRILEGELTPGAATPALRMDREERLEQEMKALKIARHRMFTEIELSFPGHHTPPALRHLYDKQFPCTPKNDALYGTVVGYDLGLVLNSYPVMLMLFDKAYALWSKCSEEQKDRTTMGDTAFYARLSLGIIKDAIASNQKDTILVSFTSNDLNYMVGIGPDTFAIGESHGRDARMVSAEPAFIHRLYGSLSKAERRHLQDVIDGTAGDNPSLAPEGRKRVEHIALLLREMGEGVLKRYFTTEVGRGALPQRLDNTALQEIFNDKTVAEIQEKAPSLQRAIQIKWELLDGLHATVNFYKKRSKLERDLWQCCGRFKYPAAVPLDEVAARLDDPAATSTADFVVNLLMGYEESKSGENADQVLKKAIELKGKLPAFERARLEKMCRQLEVSHPDLIGSLILLNRDDNYRPVKAVLEEMKAYAQSSLNNANSTKQAQVYADWLGHIETRLEKIKRGKRVELAGYYQYVRGSENGSRTLVTATIPLGNGAIVCYPEWIKHFASERTEERLIIEVELTPFVHHTQSPKRRRLATAIIGMHSDPDAAIPIMTEEVAIQERAFLARMKY